MQMTMQKRFALVASLAGFLAIGSPARAFTILSDNFDSNPPGLNSTPGGWTVTDGTVDIIGVCNGATFVDLIPGNGCYIDLDGSTFDPGFLSRNVELTSGTPYVLTFDLAGNQRTTISDTVDISFGTSTLQLTLNQFDSFNSYSLAFTPTTSGIYTIGFQNGGIDRFGALLDNVEVQQVPAPLPLLGAGAAFAYSRKLRRRLAKHRV